ncbi:MAG: preprotein translocase subunit SecG [Campylobacter sp.]|uniref:preprotein translocase subunit SecG n=1 Tax=Campylobacter sp. TaxID=205 RepID=UPI002AA6DE18|nr:preprotein translocase subunit SecG [Campylobacter sp.]MCI6178162.1 preprotein translocase subunit SecG [Campylobacter sp.]
MSTLFLVLQFVFAILLTIAILLQKSSSIGLGVYSGSNESLFGAKGPAGFLAKFTFFVGALFILNTIALGYTYNESLRGSLTQSKEFKSLVPDAAPAAPISNAPAAPVMDANQTQAVDENQISIALGADTNTTDTNASK